MAVSDYILCCKCGCKLLYDGDVPSNRDWWKERWGVEPKLLCQPCAWAVEAARACLRP
jgi:hypothetical protein